MSKDSFVLAILVALLGLGSFVSCGGGNVNPPPPPPPIKVTISPDTDTTVIINQTQKFTANVAVTWSVGGAQGGNSTVGTIGTDGTYTAPNFVPDPAKVTVKATSVSDTSKSASVNVNVTMVAWNKDYKITAAGEILHGAVAASNGNITAVGLDTLAQSHAVGISYDKNGNLLWAKTYNDFAFLAAAIDRETETDLGGDLIESNPVIGIPLVAAVDANGNITRTTTCPGNGSGYIWASFQDSPTSGVFVGKLGDSVVIWKDVGGVVDCEDTTVVHDLDNQGTWPLFIVSTADHYLLAGQYAGGVVTNKSSYVVMTDKSGNKIWRKNFPDVIAGIATERMEGTNLSVYFTGRDVSRNEQKFFTVRLDSQGNTWPGWPVEWNGDNPASGVLVNSPSGIVPNPSAVGGIVIAGFSSKLTAQDANDTDTVLISYKPDGTVYWKHRTHLSSVAGGEQIQGAILDPDNNMIVAGAGGLFNNITSLAAKIALPH